MLLITVIVDGIEIGIGDLDLHRVASVFHVMIVQVRVAMRVRRVVELGHPTSPVCHLDLIGRQSSR